MNETLYYASFCTSFLIFFEINFNLSHFTHLPIHVLLSQGLRNKIIGRKIRISY